MKPDLVIFGRNKLRFEDERENPVKKQREKKLDELIKVDKSISEFCFLSTTSLKKRKISSARKLIAGSYEFFLEPARKFIQRICFERVFTQHIFLSRNFFFLLKKRDKGILLT